jgi:hypothetical protein
VDVRSSQARISGRRERGNLGDPPFIAGLDLRFDDSRHNRRGPHLGRTLCRLHMAFAPPYSPRYGENNTILFAPTSSSWALLRIRRAQMSA